MNNHEFNLFTRLLIVLTGSMLFATFSYHFLDKPIAYWTVDHHIVNLEILKKITLLPKLFEIASLFLLPFYILSWGFGYAQPLLTNLSLASIALVITDFWNEWLKFSFGRYWPRTWAENNPSLIDSNDYGFHFFHSKAEAYQSFPSGHTALTVTVLTFIGLRYPRLRIPAFLIGLMVPFSLISLDYHFLADTIAGAGLGWAVAYCLSTFTAKTAPPSAELSRGD